MRYNVLMGKNNRFGRSLFEMALIFLVIGTGLSVMFSLHCSNPAGPDPFVSIKIEADDPDSSAYTGVPVRVVASFDSAVSFGEIQWETGKGVFFKRRSLASSDTTSTDTVWLKWNELPEVPLQTAQPSWDQDTNQAVYQPTDTIWAEYRGAISNKVRVIVANRPPIIDSVVVNNRKIVALDDTMHISGNHGTMAYIKIYASDPDGKSILSLQWLQKDSLGKIVFEKDPEELASNQTVTKWIWERQWEAYSVDSIGDSTAITTGVIKVWDNGGGFIEMPFKIIIYRESGSVWVASTGENSSSLIKYSNTGEELFRIPGFKEITSMAVNPRQEVVWFTDQRAGKVYCITDDGNMRYEIKGFSEPNAIDVHGERGFVCVADKDSAWKNAVSSRVKIINNRVEGTIDTAIKQSLLGHISFMKINQNRIKDIWILWTISSSDSLDNIQHFNNFWISDTTLKVAKGPSSIDINYLADRMWITDKYHNQLLQLSLSARVLQKKITGFSSPQMLAVNSMDTTCWVVDTDNNRVVKILPDIPNGMNIETDDTDENYHKTITSAFGIDFKQPGAIAVNSHEDGGVIWVVDTQNNRVVKLDPNGTPLLSVKGFGMESPRFIAVNPGTR